MKYIFSLILLVPFFSCFAQLRINDSTDFQLIYKESANPDWGLEKYHFINNYFVRENPGMTNIRLNGEEVIQIGDVERKSLFNYFTESKNLIDNYISSLGMVNYQIVSQNDTIIDGNDILHLKLVSNRGNTLTDITTTNVYYLKNLGLPDHYASIGEVYGWKNNLFNGLKKNVIYRYISEWRGEEIVNLQLTEIVKSDYSPKEIELILEVKQ